MISKLYVKQKGDPPLARDQPPVAGKILWARQLFHRVQQPMQLFQQHPAVLQTAEAKPVIHRYNRVAKALLEFEVLYHRAWLQQVSLYLYALHRHLHCQINGTPCGIGQCCSRKLSLWVFYKTGVVEFRQSKSVVCPWKKIMINFEKNCHKPGNWDSLLFNLQTPKGEDPINWFLSLVK